MKNILFFALALTLNPSARSAEPELVATKLMLGMNHWHDKDSANHYEAAFLKEIENGNFCLESIKRDFDKLKTDPEIQELCKRFNKVNDEMTDKKTSCFISLNIHSGHSGYTSNISVNSLYAAPRYKHTYDFYTQLDIESKLLHPKTWAGAMAANKCTVDKADIKKAVEEYAEPLEKSLAERAKFMKEDSQKAELAMALANCKNQFNANAGSIKDELERIENYIPSAWFSPAENATVTSAKTLIKRGASRGQACLDANSKLADLYAKLQRIKPRRGPAGNNELSEATPAASGSAE